MKAELRRLDQDVSKVLRRTYSYARNLAEKLGSGAKAEASSEHRCCLEKRVEELEEKIEELERRFKGIETWFSFRR